MKLFRAKYGALLTLCLVAITLILVSCEKQNDGASGDLSRAQGKLQKVTVAQFGEFFLYMPLYLAEGKGFFREEGLDVNIVSTGGDDKTFAAVISGDAQFGIADPTFVAIAASKGQPGKVIAGIVNGVPFWGVAKNPNVPEIKEPSQLKGLTVATFPSPSTAFTLQSSMFKTAGLEPNIRQAGFGAVLPLIESGQADIALELEPNVSTAVAGGARVVYSMAEMYGDFAITGVTVSNDYTTRSPAVVQAFVNAIQKAERYLHSNSEDAISFAKQRFPNIDPSIVASALRRVIESNTLPSSAVVSAEAWERACNLRIEAKELPSLDAARGVLDNSFAQRAASQVK